MKAFINKALFFLRLTDEDGLLSITYIACWVVITKIALSPEPSIAEMAGLLTALGLYFGKKHINIRTKKFNDAQQDALNKMQETVNALKDKVGAVAATVGFKRV